MKASAFFTKDGELILIDLDEILCLEGNSVIFKGSDQIFNLHEETVESLRKTFSAHSPA